MNDYERVAQIIRWLDDRQEAQPALENLSRVAGLSGSRLHRLFVKWVGITPKDFLQCLTLRHAREALSEGRSVIEAALESGLSGTGRLHDLCVTLEAATPGEVKSGGEGMRIVYGFGATPFGGALVAESQRGVCHLMFADEGGRDSAVEVLIEEWRNAEFARDDRAAVKLLKTVFEPVPDVERPHIRAWVNGTEFQIRVWRALLEIPRGTLASYGQLAEIIGRPSASRAVGTAIGSNSLACLIPCHRVIRETGAIGGYRWGNGRKRALIAWETFAPPATLALQR